VPFDELCEPPFLIFLVPLPFLLAIWPSPFHQLPPEFRGMVPCLVVSQELAIRVRAALLARKLVVVPYTAVSVHFHV
jgi:hypothetical protein